MARTNAPASLVSSALLLTAAALVAVHAAPETTQQRRFIGGVELATADFIAVDSDGRPVSDLTPEEVSLRIDGRARTIRSLQFIEVAGSPAAESPAEPLPPPYGSNSMSDAGRAFIIVVDDESFRPGKEVPMRTAIGDLLKGLSRRDRVALVTVPHGGMKVDLTTDHSRIVTALTTVVGRAPQQLNASDESCRSRRTLESLDGLLRGLGGGQNPTTILFFSSSLLGPRRDSLTTAPPGVCEIKREDFQFVGQSAAAARAQFFVVMPTEVMPDPAYEAANFLAATGSANPMEGLEHLAGLTGGHRLTLATTQARPLDRILHETSGYYLIGFEPEASDRNGERHGIDISISRPGVVLRARPYVSIDVARPDDPIPTLTPLDMLREATVYRDLPLRTTAYVSRGDRPGELQVLAVAEAIEPSAALTAASIGLFDDQGRLTAQWTASSSELGRRAVMGGLYVAPGVYRLRVAARDSTGRNGTADTDIRVELTGAGSLQLSSVVLGLSRAAGDAGGAGFQPKLEFTTEPVAIGLVEIYGGEEGARVAALVELAASIDGPALLTLPLAIEPTSDPDRFQATGAVPIGGLPAGDYIVRMIVGLEGESEGQAIRTIRKVAG